MMMSLHFLTDLINIFEKECKVSLIAEKNNKVIENYDDILQQISIENIIEKVRKENKTKISQFNAIRDELGEYFPNQQECTKLAAKIMKQFKQNKPEPINDYHSDDEYYSFSYPKWRDYTKNERLRSFKESLPLSIQIIIEFANKLIGYDQIIDIDFDEFENDLKYQYKKYNGDKQKLKKLYFNYNPTHINDARYDEDYHKTDEYEGRYWSLLKVATIIHFLFIHSNKKQALIMLKLIFKNKIIDIYDIFDTIDGNGMYIIEGIKRLILLTKNKEINTDIIDEIIELILICFNLKEFDESEAIIKVFNNKVIFTDDFHRFGQRFSEYSVFLGLNRVHSLNLVNTQEGYFYGSQMNNKYNIIQKLLFRAILPFQYIDCKILLRCRGTGINRENTNIYQPKHDENCGIKQVIKRLLQTERIWEKINIPEIDDDGEQKEEDEIQPNEQMAVLSPLILLPYLNRARDEMNKILSEYINNNGYIKNEYLSKEIANNISAHIFVDYLEFFDKDILNDFNVKSLLILNHLKHFKVDDIFLELFKSQFSDKEFLKYFVENYSKSLAYFIGNSTTFSFEFIYLFIDTYNDNKRRYPLNDIYTILTKMIDNVLGDHRFYDYYNEWLKLLKYFKNKYEDEFDINFYLNKSDDFRFDPFVRNAGLIETILSRWNNDDEETDHSHISRQIIDFILTEFKNKYKYKDKNNKCLLYYCLKRGYFNFIKCFIIKHNDKYSLKKICDTLMKVVNDTNDINKNSDSQNGNIWKCDKEEIQIFLNKLKQFCLSKKCINKYDEEMLNDVITKIYDKH